MHNYLIFCGNTCYPLGGWDDFAGYARTIEDALEIIACKGCDWWHIIDTRTMEITREGTRK